MSQTTTMTVRISGALSEFVASNVGENGSYENISEYIRDLIRKDQEEQAVQRLRGLIEEGLASGPAEARTDDDLNELRAIARGERA